MGGGSLTWQGCTCLHHCQCTHNMYLVGQHPHNLAPFLSPCGIWHVRCKALDITAHKSMKQVHPLAAPCGSERCVWCVLKASNLLNFAPTTTAQPSKARPWP